MIAKKQTIGIALLSALLLIGMSASAQFKFGIKASRTLNSMYLDHQSLIYPENPEDDIDASTSFVAGFNAGIVAEYFFSEKISLGAEIMYAQQGFETNYERTFIFNGTTYGHLSYYEKETTKNLIIPVVARYYIHGFSIEAGPQIGICLGGKSFVRSTVEDYNTFHSFQQKTKTTNDFSYTYDEIEEGTRKYLPDFKYYNRLQFGITAGLAYNFDFGLFVGARYSMDFTDTFNKVLRDEGNQPYDWTSFKSKNSVISISLGFKF